MRVGRDLAKHKSRDSKDAWHAMKGYRSGRDMNLIVHSKTHGEVLRARCDVVMIQ